MDFCLINIPQTTNFKGWHGGIRPQSPKVLRVLEICGGKIYLLIYVKYDIIEFVEQFQYIGIPPEHARHNPTGTRCRKGGSHE